MGNVVSDCKDLTTEKCITEKTCNDKVNALSAATGVGWGVCCLCCCCCVIWMIISLVLLQKMNAE